MTAFPDEEAEIEASRAPLLDHLIELRSRLIVCVAAYALAFLGCFFFANAIFVFLTHPFFVAAEIFASGKAAGSHGPFDLLLAIMGLKPIVAGGGSGIKLISTAPLETFFAKVKIGAFGAILVSFPVLAFQLYRFVAPGLYRRERRAFLPFLFASPVLFMLGAALVYYVMLPFVLWFSLNQQVLGGPGGVSVELLPKVSDYLGLVTTLILAFGLCFQMPVILALLGMANVVRAESLAKGRRFAIVGVVVVAAIVTPPDPISQLLLSAPLVLLYEASIWIVRLIEWRRGDAEEGAPV